MTTSLDAEVVFESEYSPPYNGFISNSATAEGRWFTVPDKGTIWTDDADVVGMLPLLSSATSGKDFVEFNNLRLQGRASDMIAAEVFDLAVEYYQDNDPTTPIEISSGTLEELTHIYGDTTLSEETTTDDAYAITVDEAGNVLEFVKMNTTGTYLRDGDDWEKLDPDADEDEYPTFYGQEYIDVSEDALRLFDAEVSKDKVSKDLFSTYTTRA